jgi:hypothetical protein
MEKNAFFSPIRKKSSRLHSHSLHSRLLCLLHFPRSSSMILPENSRAHLVPIFPLQADLCGIKWKKLVLNERPLATGDPLDDPVLRSYTKCLAKDILCVWRRVSQHKNELDQTGGMGMFDMSQIGVTSVIHPPLSLTAAKELWIFWYGEEPDLTDLVSPELLKAPGKYIR